MGTTRHASVLYDRDRDQRCGGGCPAGGWRGETAMAAARWWWCLRVCVGGGGEDMTVCFFYGGGMRDAVAAALR